MKSLLRSELRPYRRLVPDLGELHGGDCVGTATSDMSSGRKVRRTDLRGGSSFVPGDDLMNKGLGGGLAVLEVG